VEIYEETSIVGFHVPPKDSPTSEKVRISLKCSNSSVPAEVECDIFLAALGRRPNVTGFGLQKLGVKFAQRGGHIEVDGNFQSNVDDIYAAGDVIGPPSLASTGVHQAQGAVVSMFHEGQAQNKTNFPVGMWTTPECAYYGLTKEAAEKKEAEEKKTEAQKKAEAEAEFDRIDRNSDDKISRNEWAKKDEADDKKDEDKANMENEGVLNV